MRAEYYADEYRRYSTFIRNYGDEPIYKIAGGPNVDDSYWMEILMQHVAHAAQGVSLHNYTYEKDWREKGSATEFGEDGWYSIMANSMNMEKIVSLHESIMDRYDPDNKIALIVDEWGNWFDVEPGTNPGFLYQQNTVRDAVSAMLVLHIFHNHSKRVQMANIAQTVNVLQAMVLTEGDKMLLTPTYHVFKMMKSHMDAELLDIDYDSKDYEYNGIKIPKISISASEKNGKITVSVCNTSVTEEEDMTLEIRDADFTSALGEVLTGEMNGRNTFENPDAIAPKKLDVSADGKKISFKLPAKSAAVITLS